MLIEKFERKITNRANINLFYGLRTNKRIIMLSIPQPQDSGSKIDVLRNKAINLYQNDLGYQQNINDAFLIMKMAEKNSVVPSFRFDALEKAKSLIFDVKLLTMPDVNDLSAVNDSVTSIIGKLEKIVNSPIAANIKMIGAQQRINQNLPKILNKTKETLHLQEENTAPTPRTTQTFITLMAPIIFANKIKLFNFQKTMQQEDKELNKLTQLLRDSIGTDTLTEGAVDSFISDITKGNKIISPEQGRLLIDGLSKGIAKLKHDNLPVEWQVVLEQENEKWFDLLAKNNTEEVAKLLDNEIYKPVMSRENNYAQPLRMNGA